VRVYYLSWLKSKILRTDTNIERKAGWINVGDLASAVHFKIVKYERIKFLVIALRDSIEIYAWAPKPYHKFMAFKTFSGEYFYKGKKKLYIIVSFLFSVFSFSELFGKSDFRHFFVSLSSISQLSN